MSFFRVALASNYAQPPPPPPPSPVRGPNLPGSGDQLSKPETNKNKCLVAIDELIGILTHTSNALTDAQRREGTATQLQDDIAGTVDKLSGIISRVYQFREQREMQLANAASDDAAAAPESHGHCLSALGNLKEQIQEAYGEVYTRAEDIGDAKLMYSYGRLMGAINKWERMGKPGSSA
ncbi:unnamed protein product [Gongylonema pulchrum]|uniref:Mediator complex subunit 11 n=1 Tax=Gongylonema pulchrum TaxID=637853 RepID=A0A183DSM0_9BILA|nr:unnamed protein product [Gongylonema pulchrum]